MGNYISCTLGSPIGKNSNQSPKVIFPTGEIQQFHQPIKAAEVMLDAPNFFLVNSKSLQLGRRFSSLNADEDLEISNVFIMFSMKRLNSLVTAADLGLVFMAAKKKCGSIGNVRIQPEEQPMPKLNLDQIEEFSSEEIKQRLSMRRSKKPLLETIAEEPVFLR